VATAGDYVALACPMGEAGKHLIGLTLDGQRLWGLNTAWPSMVAHLARHRRQDALGRHRKEEINHLPGEHRHRPYVPWQQMTKDAQGKEFPMLELEFSDWPGSACWTSCTATGRSPEFVVHRRAERVLAVCLTREGRSNCATPKPATSEADPH